LSESIEDIRNEALKLLREDYPQIKVGMCRLEVFMRAKSKKAVYELRDFLDHLASLFRDDITIEDAKKDLYECRTHLRRCAVEPLEYMAEKRFVKLDRYARWFACIPIVFRDNPLSKPEFFQRMQEAKQLLVEGRRAKTEGSACGFMNDAFAIVTDLLGQIDPLKYLLQGLFWLLTTFTGAVLATLVTLWLVGGK